MDELLADEADKEMSADLARGQGARARRGEARARDAPGRRVRRPRRRRDAARRCGRAPSRRTGPRCCSACTCDGPKREKLDVEVDETLLGDEAGIKSATFIVHGPYAYGLLSAERGVHRLVRISPFDAQKRRHTSFANLDVIPVLEEAADEDILIDPKDLRIDVYRSTGPGGQSVNTTDSAVRITHLPTGITAACQNERSQLQNRAVAMRILKARLAERMRAEQQTKLENLRGERKGIDFGSQIRSYVLAPYRMVKDHRTDVEIGDVDRVLDGDLEELIEAELRRRAESDS
jgi:peptide chain release factor 2